MIARQVTAFIKKGSLDDALKIYEESVVPEGKIQEGYRGIYVMTNRELSKIISITLWDSTETMIRNEASGYYQAQVDKFKDYLVKPVDREIYEVSLMLTKAK